MSASAVGVLALLAAGVFAPLDGGASNPAPAIRAWPLLIPATPSCAFARIDACPHPRHVTITLEYEVGAEGMAAGGGIAVSLGDVLGGRYRRAMRFAWPTLQTVLPAATEFVSATTTRPGVEADLLAVDTEDGGIEIVVIINEDLQPGDMIRVLLGDTSAGGAGMRVPGIPVTTSVLVRENTRGPGGRFEYLDRRHGVSFPVLEIHGGAADNFHVILPSEAAVGAPTMAAVVAMAGFEGPQANALRVRDHAGPLQLTVSDSRADLPEVLGFTGLERGVLRFPVRFGTPGVHRLHVSDGGMIEGTSNPIRVTPSPVRLRTLWGELHVHSGRSWDGAGETERAFQSARDDALLDFLAVSDHCDSDGYSFADSRRIADAFDEPGVFVALPAYEWTSNAEGHRHVIYPDSTVALAACDEIVDMTEDLSLAPTLEDLDREAAVRGAVTIVHHPLWSGPLRNPIQFTFGDPDNPPITQKLLEIHSQHGRSEFYDNEPYVIHGNRALQQLPSVPSSFQDALGLGFRFGLTAGTDDHMSLAHASVGFNFGSTNVRYSRKGLTAAVAAGPTREAVFEALQRRRTYATTGARIRLRVDGNGRAMGSTVLAARRAALRVQVSGTSAVERIVLVRDAGWVQAAWTPPPDTRDICVRFHSPLPAAETASFYVRVEQADAHLAWSSPIWYEPARRRRGPRSGRLPRTELPAPEAMPCDVASR